MLRQRDERIGVVEEGRHMSGVVQAVSGGERIHHEYVEHPNGAERADDRQRDAAPRVSRLFAERRGRVESDEGQESEHHARVRRR